MKIWVGSVVKSNIVGMEENTRDEKNSRIKKEVVGCVHDLVKKNNLLVQFEGGQKREISASLMLYLCYKDRVGQ